MYEFEKNKANNLILYGITVKHPETSDSLKNRIANVFRDHLNIRREIAIQKASRVHTGKNIGIAVAISFFLYPCLLSSNIFIILHYFVKQDLMYTAPVQYWLHLKPLKIVKRFSN